MAKGINIKKLVGFYVEGGINRKFFLEVIDKNDAPKTKKLKEFRWMKSFKTSLHRSFGLERKIKLIQKDSYLLIAQSKGCDELGSFTALLQTYIKNPDNIDTVNMFENKSYFIMFKKYNNNKPHDAVIMYIGKVMKNESIKGIWYLESSRNSFEIKLSENSDDDLVED